MTTYTLKQLAALVEAGQVSATDAVAHANTVLARTNLSPGKRARWTRARDGWTSTGHADVKAAFLAMPASTKPRKAAKPAAKATTDIAALAAQVAETRAMLTALMTAIGAK